GHTNSSNPGYLPQLDFKLVFNLPFKLSGTRQYSPTRPPPQPFVRLKVRSKTQVEMQVQTVCEACSSSGLSNIRGHTNNSYPDYLLNVRFKPDSGLLSFGDTPAFTNPHTTPT